MFKVKNVFKEWYEPQQSYVVRNPLFPIEKFFNWKADEENIDAAKEILRKSLREFYLQPLVQEALYIGSPDLHDQLQLWLNDKIEKPEKICISVVKLFVNDLLSMPDGKTAALQSNHRFDFRNLACKGGTMNHARTGCLIVTIPFGRSKSCSHAIHVVHARMEKIIAQLILCI